MSPLSSPPALGLRLPEGLGPFRHLSQGPICQDTSASQNASKSGPQGSDTCPTWASQAPQGALEGVMTQNQDPGGT